MGRQFYFTRLALGRSPFEPVSPETHPGVSTAEESNVQTNTASSDRVHSDEASEYVQQYDSRGRPENSTSRRLTRRFRRAQNDVLANVGVCEGIDAEGQPKTHPRTSLQLKPLDEAKIKMILRENQVGQCLSFVYFVLCFTTQMWITSLRNRVQTFHIYSGIPLVHVLATEWKLAGFKFLVAGQVSAVAYLFVGAANYLAIDKFLDLFVDPLLLSIKSRKRRKRISQGLIAAKNILEAVSFVLISPFQVYSTLQCLDLVSSTPLLPWPRMYLSILKHTAGTGSRLHDSQPQRFSYMLVSKILPPMLTCYALTHLRSIFSTKIHQYIRAALPKPSHPDINSLKAAKAFDLGINYTTIRIEGCWTITESSSMKEQLARDLQSFGRHAQILSDNTLELFRKVTHSSLLNVLGIKQRLAKLAEDSNTASDRSDEASSQRTEAQTDGTLDPADASLPGLQNDTIDTGPPTNRAGFRVPETPESELQEESMLPEMATAFEPRVFGPSLGQEPRPAEEGTISSASTRSPSPSSRPPVRIRTSDTSDGNMAIAIIDNTGNAPVDDHPASDAAGAQVEYDPIAMPIQLESHFPQPEHRVTVLTGFAAEYLAQTLSRNISNVVLLPLEGLIVRSIALAFLSAPPSNATASRWRSEIYPIFGSGLRAGRWSSVGDYVSKMALISGMELGLGLAVWQMGTGLAWWMGRKWFRWGTF